ncbi:MAG: hypothetical protein OMM_02059 [Candidatus Magnetoglobus multicellularis str. Araruama]|uniref:RCC1-like domain-containing protein n=1 Tax=Candidatus Magnetoglobus multicellularis str. Araruama TaxID=890399 RepID=A0A1V1PBD2_9BACT|nr:MAG: hypothetical protein OMM_02059 [Candidatus Magnetoglobus multicellularis str. Araruama]
MKGVKRFYALFFCIIWFLSGPTWANEAPKIFVQSYANHIVAGGHHSIAIDENGQLWAWGSNGSGRLGNATAGTKASVPVPVNTVSGDGQLSNIISVAAGFSHSIALLDNGRVVAWGSNNSRQLGNVSINQSSYLPVYVNGPDQEMFLTDIIAVAAGQQHSVALCSDGTVWTWGDNTKGQLGNNSLFTQERPIQVTDSQGTGFLSQIIAIAAGAYHTLALDDNGYIWAWGNNADGQLGIGSDVSVHQTPFPINDLSNITHICAGESHSLARKSNGTVWAWGNNADGQLGYETGKTFSNIPHQVMAPDGLTNLLNVIDIAAGSDHSLALKNDTTLMAWGKNDNGQLGDGTQGSLTFPVWVKDTNGIDPVKNIIEISAGDGHSLALCKDGQVLAWGNNNDGQLGNMSATQRLLPIYVRDESAEKTLQLGIQQILVHVSEDQSADAIPLILRDTDGQNLKLSALSSNESLIPAHHFEFNYHSQPYTIPVPSEESVSVSFTFKTAENQYGAGNITIVAEDTLGASDTVLLQIIVTPVNDPPLISNIDNIEIDEDTISPIIPFMVQDVDQDDLTVTARSFHTTVIAPSGITVTGDAMNRQIQICPLPDQYGSALISLTVSDPSGLSSEETFYVDVQSVNDIPKMRIWPGIRQVACGYHHNIAIKNDWTVWAWGFNGAGQLGDDTQSPHNLPTQVKGRDGIGWLTDIIAVAGGSQHSVALSGDGHVLAWGGNDYGQLGNGTGASSFVPVYVLNEDNLPFEDVIAIASGTNHVLLVTENNELWAWGNNENGQLANSVALSYNRPIRVAGLPSSHRIVQTAAGYAHSLVLLDNGEIWAWGDNTFGQLGIGDSVSAMNPTQVVQEDGTPLTNIVSIAAGAFHSLALSNDGTIWAFGSNQEGQGGNGGLSHISIPAKVQHPENGMPLANIARIAAGTDHSLAIQNNGVVWAWGNNKQGQLGDGTKDNHHLPQIIRGTDLQLDQIISVDAGKHHSVLHAGDIWAWGANYSFQLGTGIAEESLVPTQTLSPDGSEPFVPGLFSLEFYTSDGIPAHPIHVSLYDLETQSTALKFSATSHDPQILPQENIVLKGSGVNRQIILTPLVDRTGKVSVELMVSDNTDAFTQQLTLGVNKFSLAPTVSDIEDQMADEDQAVTNLSFTIDDPDTPIDQLSVQVTSSNISLVPNHPDMLNWSDEGEHRTLSITPIENRFGKTIITLRVTDGINIARSTFTLTFQPVNDPPKLSRIDDQEISSNEFSKSVGFSITDIETEPKNLSTWVISSNPAIVPNDEHHLIISGTENHRTLGITPSREEAGELTITIYASDGIETCATSFHLMVQNYKKSPQLSDIENQIIQEDTSLTIEFTVTDGDSDVNELAFSLSSSNKQVIPNDTANLVLSGSGENRSLLIVPEPDQVGSVSITIEVKDSDKLYDQESFMVTVENVNDTPTISGIIDQAIKENTSTPELEFTIHDIETSAEALLLTVNSANPNLVPNDDVHLKLTGESNNRKLVVTPKADTTGDTVIRIQLSDGELAVWESFVLTVEPENFPPEISTITDQFTEVNTAIEIDFTISDPESPSGSLIVTALSSDPELVPNDTNHLKLSRGTGSDDRCLTITPLADVCGSLTITLMVKDDLSTTEQAFSLTINYPPTISSISNRRTNEDTQTPPIPFVVNDQDTDIQLLETTAHSDNTALIPNDIEHIILMVMAKTAPFGYYQKAINSAVQPLKFKCPMATVRPKQAFY